MLLGQGPPDGCSIESVTLGLGAQLGKQFDTHSRPYKVIGIVN